ncbi:hypothetical protein F5Y14DRAFT_450618 [Nemania sp. NC0429]|nr:hypothetical protein F5Y14DRAFT_450618 [Nemania sp. NC0429]
MNKGMVSISSQGPEDAATAAEADAEADAPGFGDGLPFLAAASSASSATTPGGMDVFWAHTTADDAARYCHGARYLRAGPGPAEQRECVTPDDFWPYAPIHAGLGGGGPEPVGGPAPPSNSAQGRMIEQSVINVEPSTPVGVVGVPGQLPRRDSSVKGSDATTTSDESSTGSARCTPWMLVSTSSSSSGTSMAADHSHSISSISGSISLGGSGSGSSSSGGGSSGGGGAAVVVAGVAGTDMRQHREKNRVAARKCRQKAKDNAVELQRRERELRQQNKMLLGYVGSLREEILDLKDEILRHSDCGSGVIQNYIASAARRQME